MRIKRTIFVLWKWLIAILLTMALFITSMIELGIIFISSLLLFSKHPFYDVKVAFEEMIVYDLIRDFPFLYFVRLLRDIWK